MKAADLPCPSSTVERLLVMSDEPPYDCVYRVVLGFLMLDVPRALDQELSGGRLVATVAGVLLALRVVPAICRKLLPFSAAALEIWRTRRALAKHFDSYQWRKLFWIGTGMLVYARIRDIAEPEVFVLASAFVVSGCAGLLRWTTLRTRGVDPNRMRFERS
jgi:hypothetical protein